MSATPLGRCPMAPPPIKSFHVRTSCLIPTTGTWAASMAQSTGPICFPPRRTRPDGRVKQTSSPSNPARRGDRAAGRRFRRHRGELSCAAARPWRRLARHPAWPTGSRERETAGTRRAAEAVGTYSTEELARCTSASSGSTELPRGAGGSCTSRSFRAVARQRAAVLGSTWSRARSVA